MVRMIVMYVLAAVFAALTLLTLLMPQWIEAVFNVDPDRGSGALEWVIVAISGLLALVAAIIGTRDAVRLKRRAV